ncbi:MAG: sulfurtransferase TusA family protein [Candidatus Heimdallarchaeota archaeon]|nr:MAG: sulfurtransferase TusA family protein [Candidatus Heimdallarchaeota archaeon]
MKKKYGKNMSSKGYYFKNTFRYWRKTFKMLFRYESSEWSEITVDELYKRFNTNQPTLIPLILDIRTIREYTDAHVPTARQIYVTEIKANLESLQTFKEKEIVTICPGGGLSLVAVDILVDAGFKDVKSLKDGMDLWVKKGYPTTTNDAFFYPSKSDRKIIEKESLDKEYHGNIHHTVDAKGLHCPHPIMKSVKALRALEIGQVLEILTTDPGSKTDIPAWVRSTGHTLLISEQRGPKEFRFLVKRMK